MRTKSNATQNLTSGMSRAVWRVIAVEPLPEFCLAVHFMDGTCGKIYMAEFIKSAGAGVFAKLKDEIDLAPDAMYQEIKQNGHWVIKSEG